MRLFLVLFLLSQSIPSQNQVLHPVTYTKTSEKPVPIGPFLRSFGHPLDVVYWKTMRFYSGFISYFAVGAQRNFFLLVEKLSEKIKNQKIFVSKINFQIFQKFFSQKFSQLFQKFFSKKSSTNKTLPEKPNRSFFPKNFFDENFQTKNNFLIFFSKILFFEKNISDNFFLPRPRSNFFDEISGKFHTDFTTKFFYISSIPDLYGNRTVLGKRTTQISHIFPIIQKSHIPPPLFFYSRIKTGMGKMGNRKNGEPGRSKMMGREKSYIFFFSRNQIFIHFFQSGQTYKRLYMINRSE